MKETAQQPSFVLMLYFPLIPIHLQASREGWHVPHTEKLRQGVDKGSSQWEQLFHQAQNEVGVLLRIHRTSLTI